MQNETNLNQILQKIPHGTVITSSWLEKQGISRGLRSAYKKNGWLKSIGNGAYFKLNDKIDLNGFLYALQTQLNLTFHVGGISALSVLGLNHNIAFDRKTYIYGFRGEKIPNWFKSANNNIKIIKTEFLPKELGLIVFNDKNFSIKISSQERAILEAIYLTPEKNSIKEIYQLMETMSILKPELIQKLLENCSNIKVKRLFLYMAEKLNYPWFKKLDISKIDLGKGKRTIEKGGKLNKKYNIVIQNVEEI